MSSNIEVTKICELCGSSFTARKTTTQYCSHKCSQRAYKLRIRNSKIDTVKEYVATMNSVKDHFTQKKSAEYKLNHEDLATLNMKEYLSVFDAALILGVGRSTIHRYCVDEKLKCIKMNRKIFIRKKDVEGMFEYAPTYKVTPKVISPNRCKSTLAIKENLQPELKKEQSYHPITEFYSADEIAQKFGVTKGAVHRRATSNSIPKITYQGRLLYSKTHIDKLYQKDIVDPTIDQWYLAEEIKSLYNMNTAGVYSVVSENSVPKKNEKGKTLYSKKHIDELLYKRLGDSTITEWYSVEDIQNKYGLKSGYIANFVFINKIPKKRTNSKGYYSKEHFDKAIIEKNPPTVYITVEDAALYFSLSKEEVHRMVVKYNIPKIKDGKFIKIQKIGLNQIINPPKLY